MFELQGLQNPKTCLPKKINVFEIDGIVFESENSVPDISVTLDVFIFSYLQYRWKFSDQMGRI
jgi:hypothetical protein